MKPQPTISVCLPVYNGERYLAGAIESVLNQTFESFELLIVDDCSTDSTWEIIDRYAIQDPRVRPLRNKQNLGLFANYNHSMASAGGQFIKLFAHDDIFRPTILQSMLAIFEQKPEVALVSTAKEWIDSDGHPISSSNPNERTTMRPFEVDTQLAAQEAITRTLLKKINWLGEPCSQMFRKEHVGSGFDARFKQIGDLELSYRILQHGDFFYMAEPLCYFRRHDDSNSHVTSSSLAARLDWFVLAAKYRSVLQNASVEEDDYVQLLTYCMSDIVYRHMFSENKSSESIVRSFLGQEQHVLDRFGGAGQSPRESLKEYEALSVFAMVELAKLQEELRLAQDQFEINQSAINSLREEIRHARNSLGAEAQELRARITDMGNSLSWKATAPLRSWNKLAALRSDGDTSKR